MRIPQLTMTSKMAQIGMDSQKASLSIETPKYPQLDIQTKHVKVKLRSTPPKLLIDQSQAFSESGLKPNGELIADNAAYGFSKGLEAIGRIVAQGNQMADFHNGDPIPDQAIENAYEQFYRDWNMVTMPRSGAKIDVIPGRVDVDIDWGEVRNNSVPQKPRISYNQAKLNIYLKQRNELTISVVDTKV